MKFLFQVVTTTTLEMATAILEMATVEVGYPLGKTFRTAGNCPTVGGNCPMDGGMIFPLFPMMTTATVMMVPISKFPMILEIGQSQ